MLELGCTKLELVEDPPISDTDDPLVLDDPPSLDSDETVLELDDNVLERGEPPVLELDCELELSVPEVEDATADDDNDDESDDD